jgi:hypothetical protein
MNCRELLLAEDVTVSRPGNDGSFERILFPVCKGLASRSRLLMFILNLLTIC